MADLFRQSALDTIATPEQLDKQVKIVRPYMWLLGVLLAMGIITLVLWSFTYPISNGIEADGVIFSNHSVAQIKASRECMVTDVLVTEGEYVEIGDILAVVSNDTLLEKIENKKKNSDIGETVNETVDMYVASTMIKSTATGYIQSICSYGSALNRGDSIAVIMPDTGYNEVISYVSLQTVQKLKVGISVQVSPTYAPREEYGYMTGIITDISEIPVTEDAILEKMGTLSYVKGILPETSCVEVRIKLNTDSNSKNQYLWSNEKGEKLSVELGTQCSVVMIMDEYKPIELLLE